jgi:transcription elongation GreA/GreB family factor
MDKAELRRAIIGKLEAELAVLVAAAHDAKAEATDAESRQEGQFDMRGQSAAYLAAGQAKLAGELAGAIEAFRNLSAAPTPPGGPATVGSVVRLAEGAAGRTYYIGPARGGLEVDWAGQIVTVVTPASPIGRQLVGRRAGDQVPGVRAGQFQPVSAVE